MGKDHELLEAARNGNITVVEKILYNKIKKGGPLASLRRGPGVNVQDSCGNSALHHAALNGHIDIVHLLLNHDAFTNLPDSRGSSALHLASWAGHYDIVKMLLTNPYRPANPCLQTIDKETPLHCAAQHGHTECLTLLLTHGADPNVPNNKGETPLDLAAQYGRLQVVQRLINGHPELLLPFKYGSRVTHSPLHLASRNGHKSVVEALLGAGVDVNMQTPSGTALHEAALCGKDAVVVALLEAGANLNAANSEGRTVMDVLEQFPPHVTRGIISVIRNHERGIVDGSGIVMDNEHNDSISRSYTEGYRDVWNSKHAKDLGNKEYLGSSVKSKSFSTADAPNVYLAMAPIDTNKYSNTITLPPKKPPRRNYSLSPTYIQNNMMSMQFEIRDQKQRDGIKQSAPYEYLFLSHSGASNADQREQYVQMHSPLRSSQSHDENSMYYENQKTGMRILNPNRKLRRNKNRNYDDYSQPSYIIVGKDNMKSSTPVSPSSYSQPPTPEHPPPTPNQAETLIHNVIRPLSQEYKRRSREMTETGTSPDNLCTSLNASSASLSSSFSISDRSVSTDCVEEFIGDVPFAGLLKGSILQERGFDPFNHKSRQIVERPKTLKTAVIQNNSDEKMENCNDSKSKVLSPFDEQEEWVKISEIMATFGETLINPYSLVVNKDDRSIEKWLESNNLQQFSERLVSNGYDNLDFMNGILEEQDCKTINIIDTNDVQLLMNAIKTLPLPKIILHSAINPSCKTVEDATTNESVQLNNNEVITMEQWLKTIQMEEYIETFRKHLYVDIEKICRIWDTELQTVLDIIKIGHRKRILNSIYGPKSTTLLQNVKNEADNNIANNSATEQRTNENVTNDQLNGSTGTNTVKPQTLTRPNRRPAPKPPIKPSNALSRVPNLEIRGPAELLLGFPTGLRTQWRHSADSFISSYVKYTAFYLGSTVVKELRGTESTRKSIQKLKRGERLNQQLISSASSKRPICLAISFCGVQFIDIDTQNIICEHEIKNIDCACQDADDLTHFAYITKDVDTHYCHVFNVDSMDLATEIILTLGQAFEVAYQIALRECSPSTPNHRGSKSHS